MACLRFKNQTMVHSWAEESGPGGKLHPHLTYTPKSSTCTCFCECVFGCFCSASWPLRVTTQPHGLYINQKSLLTEEGDSRCCLWSTATTVLNLLRSIPRMHALCLGLTGGNSGRYLMIYGCMRSLSPPLTLWLLLEFASPPTPKYFFVESNRGNLSDGRRLDWCVCRKSVNNINFIWTYEYEQAVAILTWAFFFFFKWYLKLLR